MLVISTEIRVTSPPKNVGASSLTVHTVRHSGLFTPPPPAFIKCLVFSWRGVLWLEIVMSIHPSLPITECLVLCEKNKICFLNGGVRVQVTHYFSLYEVADKCRRFSTLLSGMSETYIFNNPSTHGAHVIGGHLLAHRTCAKILLSLELSFNAGWHTVAYKPFLMLPKVLLLPSRSGVKVSNTGFGSRNALIL